MVEDITLKEENALREKERKRDLREAHDLLDPLKPEMGINPANPKEVIGQDRKSTRLNSSH